MPAAMTDSLQTVGLPNPPKADIRRLLRWHDHNLASVVQAGQRSQYGRLGQSGFGLRDQLLLDDGKESCGCGDPADSPVDRRAWR